MALRRRTSSGVWGAAIGVALLLHAGLALYGPSSRGPARARGFEDRPRSEPGAGRGMLVEMPQGGTQPTEPGRLRPRTPELRTGAVASRSSLPPPSTGTRPVQAGAPPALRVVTGRVLQPLGEPLADVRIEAPAVHRVAFSDARGQFRIALPPGRQRLRASRPGYAPAESEIAVSAEAATPEVLLRLEARVHQIAPILVQAARRGAAAPQPGRWMLDPQALQQQIASFEDVMRGVQALPGVSSASDLHGEFFVRGSDAHANAIYLDGIEIFFPYHILGFNSIFSPGLVESAEFWSGGAPAEYGDATGGVLSLRSRGAVPQEGRGTAGISWLSGSVQAAGGNARRGWAANLRRSYHDKVLQWIGVAAGRQIPAFYDLMLRGRWQPRPGHLLVAGLLQAGDGMSLPRPELAAQDLDFVGLDPAQRERALADLRAYAALNDRLKLGNSLTLGSLYWRAVLAPDAYLETTLGHVPQDFDFSLLGDNRESVRIQARTTSLRQDLTWRSPQHRLRGGWMAYRDRTARRISAWAGILNLRETNSSINLADLKERWEIDAARERRYTALYLEDEWALRQSTLRLGTGLRWEHDGLTGEDLVSPRMSLELRPDARWIWRGTWGVYHGLRDKPMEVQPTPTGAPLGAERSVEVTLGCNAALSPGLVAGASAYAKQQSHLVYEVSPALYTNGGEGRVRGLEAWLRLAPGKLPLRAALEYAWSHAQQRDPVAWRRMPNYWARTTEQFWGPVYETPYWYDPAQDERHHLGLEVQLPRRRWELGLRYQLGSGRPFTPVRWVATDPLGTKYGVVGAKGSARFPLYQRLDVRVLRRLTQGPGLAWSVYADILNVTGADNVYQYRFNPSYTSRYVVRMLPTLPTLGFEARF